MIVEHETGHGHISDLTASLALTVPVALWAVASGAGLTTVVAIGAIGEALSLGLALLAVTASRVDFADSRPHRLAEGI